MTNEEKNKEYHETMKKIALPLYQESVWVDKTDYATIIWLQCTQPTKHLNAIVLFDNLFCVSIEYALIDSVFEFVDLVTQKNGYTRMEAADFFETQATLKTKRKGRRYFW